VGQALAAAVKANARTLKLAVVHPYSSHNYELRYWLAASGIHPDRDVEMVIVPPPLMADALAAGRIDGYCVGEPWGSVSVASGAGRIATVKAVYWPASPEKVLGVTERWAAANSDALGALIRALHRAALWCTDSRNHAEAAELLARPGYLGVPSGVIERALRGRIAQAPDHEVNVAAFFVPHAGGANVPDPADALWYYSQMARWGDVMPTSEAAATAAGSYQPEIYRSAVAGLGEGVPRARRGQFFDGVSFDPSALDAYVAELRRKDLLLS
jgi:NitT/TauT family transport system ATP-binding protein